MAVRSAVRRLSFMPREVIPRPGSWTRPLHCHVTKLDYPALLHTGEMRAKKMNSAGSTFKRTHSIAGYRVCS